MSSVSQNILEIIFSLSKPKVVYLRPFLSSLPFLKFLKQNLMYFRHKHVETGPNYLILLRKLSNLSDFKYLHVCLQTI